MNDKFKVKINGKYDVLTCMGNNRYNTHNNASQHSFPFKLESGVAFKINGNDYHIIKKIKE